MMQLPGVLEFGGNNIGNPSARAEFIRDARHSAMVANGTIPAGLPGTDQRAG
jgi:hypothetical protein